jgi:hypothetical protein
MRYCASPAERVGARLQRITGRRTLARSDLAGGAEGMQVNGTAGMSEPTLRVVQVRFVRPPTVSLMFQVPG